MILAIDPGPTRSAYVMYDDGRVVAVGKEPNEDVLARVRDFRRSIDGTNHLVIEWITVASVAGHATGGEGVTAGSAAWPCRRGLRG